MKIRELEDMGLSAIYSDAGQFKNYVIQMICAGETEVVRKLLRDAPEESKFLDSREFYFNIFNQ